MSCQLTLQSSPDGLFFLRDELLNLGMVEEVTLRFPNCSCGLSIVDLMWDCFSKVILLRSGDFSIWPFNWDELTILDYPKGALWSGLGQVEINGWMWVFSSNLRLPSLSSHHLFQVCQSLSPFVFGDFDSAIYYWFLLCRELGCLNGRKSCVFERAHISGGRIH